jgi:hypothetical protein
VSSAIGTQTHTCPDTALTKTTPVRESTTTNMNSIFGPFKCALLTLVVRLSRGELNEFNVAVSREATKAGPVPLLSRQPQATARNHFKAPNWQSEKREE